MSPCISRQATPEELQSLALLPKPQKPQYTDKTNIFRRREKNALRIAGSGWIRN